MTDVEYFELTVTCDGHVLLSEQGDASKIRHCTSAYLEGFSRTLRVDLRPVWKKMLTERLGSYNTTLWVYETIIKFGETMQLSNECEVSVKIKFGE